MVGQWWPSAWSSPHLKAHEPSQEMASDPLCKAPLQTPGSQREERSVLHTQKCPSGRKSKELKIVNSWPWSDIAVSTTWGRITAPPEPLSQYALLLLPVKMRRSLWHLSVSRKGAYEAELWVLNPTLHSHTSGTRTCFLVEVSISPRPWQSGSQPMVRLLV